MKEYNKVIPMEESNKVIPMEESDRVIPMTVPLEIKNISDFISEEK